MFNFTGFPSLISRDGGGRRGSSSGQDGCATGPDSSVLAAGADLQDCGAALIRAGQAGDSGTGGSLPLAKQEKSAFGRVSGAE